MSEDVLARIAAEREGRRNAKREITFLGETLVLRASVPYMTSVQLQAAKIKAGKLAVEQQEQNEDQTLKETLSVGAEIAEAHLQALHEAEGAILDCLDPSCHEAWERLRAADSTEPLTADEMFDIADYLIGLVAELPTSAPIDSADGRTKTDKSSKENLSSPAKIRAVSG